jgi:N-acetylmuramoyl-L-alanine amidase
MFKLAITAGHYMNTPGKRCMKAIDPNETREWWLNDRIADKIEDMLAEYEGIEILRTDDTTGKTDRSLAQRTTAANDWGADFYLSIHHNAGINGGKGGGIVVYSYRNGSKASHEWRDKFYKELVATTGLKGNRSDGTLTAGFYEIKYTKMPGVLLELGFMDSTTDVPIILTEEFADKCATACVNLLVREKGLKKKAPAAAPSVKPTGPIYRVRKSWDDASSQLGAYRDLNNAKNSCPAGYFVFDEDGDIVYPVEEKKSVKNLSRGSKGDDVKRLQNLLNLLGYNCGDADGSFGPKTEKVVKQFQKDNKITSDGIFGTTSYKTIKNVLSNFNVKLDVSGRTYSLRIVALQNILKDYGFDCGESDGYRGAKTTAATTEFQRRYSITPANGIAGPSTIAAMKDYLQL